jgi:hypothetical protein
MRAEPDPERIEVTTVREEWRTSMGRAHCTLSRKHPHLIPAGGRYLVVAQIVDGEFWHAQLCADAVDGYGCPEPVGEA